MGLKLQSSIGGSVELNAPATNSNYSVTMPAQSGTMMMAENYQPSFKNRIINGAMMIDQRNAGASVTNVNGTIYSIDRWAAVGYQASKFTLQQNAGSVTPPSGFVNYLGVTSSSSYSVGSSEYFVVRQYIEGLNVADLGWGTANAQSVTLSFWVRSSLTGAFGGSLYNSAANRSFPFSFNISSANTWQQKSITIAGDTTGTWLTTNGVGIVVNFNLGSGSTFSGTAGAWAGAQYTAPTGATSIVGTNGATFYITGVQLEKGSTATSFDYRPYGTELALCQRYYEVSYRYFDLAPRGNGIWQLRGSPGFQVMKRANPTVTTYAASSGVYNSPTRDGFWMGDDTNSSNYLNGSGPTGASFTATAEL